MVGPDSAEVRFIRVDRLGDFVEHADALAHAQKRLEAHGRVAVFETRKRCARDGDAVGKLLRPRITVNLCERIKYNLQSHHLCERIRRPMIHVENTQEIGRIIREERRRQGFTQAEFAGLANVGITYLSNLENGKPTAEIEKAIRILTMLGIDLYVEKR